LIFKLENPDSARLTCDVVVNRIPDVINSVSGYVNTERIDKLEFRKFYCLLKELLGK